MRRRFCLLTWLLLMACTLAGQVWGQVSFRGYVVDGAGQDGTELLSRSPGVWLSDGAISINGTRGARLFVDEREIRLEGEELMAYLRTLRSEDVQRIGVIPVAGAAYDASARGGVIHPF